MGTAKALALGEAPDVEQDAITLAIGARDHRRALSLLMGRYGDDIFRYAVSMTRDTDLAEEVRQQVFTEAYRDLERSARPQSVVRWLFGIARHRSLDAVQGRMRWRLRYKNETPAEEESVCPEPNQELDRRKLSILLGRCLAKLPVPMREAVLLRYQQDLSYDDAAQVSGQMSTTLRQRVARALPLLRKCVSLNAGPGEWP
jgi:RNA polymerase sigma-70 factor, ECF subfamily